MEINDYIHQKKDLQKSLLCFIEDEDNAHENFERLNKLIDSQNLNKNHEEFEILLCLLNKITKNHYRYPDFFMKIKQIINYLEPSIKQSFTNTELFDIFKRNQPILLILYSKKLITIDDYNLKYILQTDRDMYYFYPEIKSFLKEEEINSIEQQFIETDKNFFSTFEEKRQIGENDAYICELIRNDSVEEFISYVNHSNFPLSGFIKSSIFETNPILLKNDNTTLIEYAAFFGSIRIFQYLMLNNVKMTSSLYTYAIHGKNGEIIDLLESNDIKPTENDSKKYFIDAIKCHHNDIADYIRVNYFDDQILENCEEIYRFYNFEFFDSLDFDFLCKYNYITLVRLLVERSSKEINMKSSSSLNFAAQRGNNFLVNYLLSQRKFDFNEISFPNCSKLTEINLPSSIKIINNFAFFGCTSLKNISIPSSVTHIGNSAFENCLSLINLSIPSSEVSIGKYCFCNCRSLKEINAKALVKKICHSTFRNCISLKHLSFSELLIDEICQHAFCGCSSLAQFSIPETVEKIGCFAFKGCSFLTEVEIPFKVTVIEPYTFADCSSLVKVKIPDSLEIIKDYAFNGCSSLTDIAIPLSVKLIDDWAFGGCCSLEQLQIPPSVKINKERAFKKITLEEEKMSPLLPINKKLFKKNEHLSHSSYEWYVSDNYIVKDKKTGKSLVEKTFLKVNDEEDDSFMYNKIESKLRLYMNADHPVFINLHGYSFEKNKSETLTVIMEKAAKGSLQDLFKAIKDLSPNVYNDTTRQIILIGVARGMKYLLDCNANQFIFPRHILLDENFHPQINIGRESYKTIERHFFDPNTSDIIYLAPEYIENPKESEDFEVNEKRLVYSFAIIMYRIATDCVPYRELKSMHIQGFSFLRSVRQNKIRPRFYCWVRDSIINLIEDCWSHDPSNRPTFKEIFEKLAYDNEFNLGYADNDAIKEYVNEITNQ